MAGYNQFCKISSAARHKTANLGHRLDEAQEDSFPSTGLNRLYHYLSGSNVAWRENRAAEQKVQAGFSTVRIGGRLRL